MYGYTLGRVLGEFGRVASEQDESGRGVGQESEKVFEDEGAELASGAGEDDLGCVLVISACSSSSAGLLDSHHRMQSNSRVRKHSPT